MGDNLNKNDCEECLCRPYCKDVDKKKYCKYQAKLMSHIEGYLHVNKGCATEKDIEKYLTESQRREVERAKMTLKAYLFIIGVISSFSFIALSPLYWNIMPLRILFFFVASLFGVMLLYIAFKPAIHAVITVVRGR